MVSLDSMPSYSNTHVDTKSSRWRSARFQPARIPTVLWALPIAHVVLPIGLLFQSNLGAVLPSALPTLQGRP